MYTGMAVEDVVSAKLVYDRYLEKQGRAKMQPEMIKQPQSYELLTSVQ